MKLLGRIGKFTLKALAVIAVILFLIFVFYFNSLRNVNPVTVNYYLDLKGVLIESGYQDQLLVVSAKRQNWHNQLLVKFGAASRSQHLEGNAIDFLVFDVNDDGNVNSSDVDIVCQILDKQILKGKGGMGTYKTEKWFWNSQMIHIDCRDGSSRWNR